MNRKTVHSRQRELVAHDLLAAYPVTIIGLGAIGSHAARVLSQLGVRDFTLFDSDEVSEVNLGTQLYRTTDIGRPKATALADVLRTFLPDLCVVARPEPYVDQELTGIVVVATDSMASRSAVWRRLRESLDVPLLVDGRTAGEELHVHTICPALPADIAWYDASLVPDAEAADVPCSASGAAHVQFVIAGLLATHIVRWVNRQPFPRFRMLDLRTGHQMCSDPDD